jgi:hypothetical protein
MDMYRITGTSRKSCPPDQHRMLPGPSPRGSQSPDFRHTLLRRDEVESPESRALSLHTQGGSFHDSERLIEDLSNENIALVTADVPDLCTTSVPHGT